jgi:hypothetical protein
VLSPHSLSLVLASLSLSHKHQAPSKRNSEQQKKRKKSVLKYSLEVHSPSILSLALARTPPCAPQTNGKGLISPRNTLKMGDVAVPLHVWVPRERERIFYYSTTKSCGRRGALKWKLSEKFGQFSSEICVNRPANDRTTHESRRFRVKTTRKWNFRISIWQKTETLVFSVVCVFACRARHEDKI